MRTLPVKLVWTALTTAVLLIVPAYAVGSLLSGPPAAGTPLAGADDPIRSGFYVLRARDADRPAAAAPRGGEAGEEIVLTSWTFSSKGGVSPWQGGGSSTTTRLDGPTSASKNSTVTFKATVMGSNSTAPGLTVTFYDGSTNIGTVNLTVPGSGSTSTCSLNYKFTTTGNHSISAKYNGDFNDAPSTSNIIVCSVK